MTKTCLLLIDLQNDFLPGGALAVPGGNQVISVANELMRDFDIVIASQDWHPSNHGSFVSQHPERKIGDTFLWNGALQVVWPDHCVQGTYGAAFPPELDVSKVSHLITKGEDPNVDSYSAFFDNAKRRATRLHALLQSLEIVAIHVMGLATDYCVQATVLDALELGYQVTLHTKGCRGVEIRLGDCMKAIEQMAHHGAEVL
jgi:nicotinamidase/pyrazinamidase